MLQALGDGDCTRAYTVLDEAIVPESCEKPRKEPVPLLKPKPLRGWDGNLSARPIHHMLAVRKSHLSAPEVFIYRLEAPINWKAL